MRHSQPAAEYGPSARPANRARHAIIHETQRDDLLLSFSLTMTWPFSWEHRRGYRDGGGRHGPCGLAILIRCPCLCHTPPRRGTDSALIEVTAILTGRRSVPRTSGLAAADIVTFRFRDNLERLLKDASRSGAVL